MEQDHLDDNEDHHCNKQHRSHSCEEVQGLFDQVDAGCVKFQIEIAYLGLDVGPDQDDAVTSCYLFLIKTQYGVT